MSNGDNIYSDMHYSVMLRELTEAVTIFENKQNIIVDCTLGLAGHASEMIKKLNKGDIFIGFDADIENLKLAKQRIDELEKQDIEVILINSNYVNLKEELLERGIEKITGIYYDCGLSSLHVDEAERGFSFRYDGPLDMRFDRTKGRTAEYVVNKYKRDELVNMIKKYGEEPQVNKISTAIVDYRQKNYIDSTKQLSELIDSVASHPKAKTRIFQAIRIEVNNEIENLEKSLEDAIGLLDKDGILFAISFHSLEDRAVKQIIKRESKGCICSDLICSCKHEKQVKILTKKPIEPSADEIKINSRSRSAKARIAQKL